MVELAPLAPSEDGAFRIAGGDARLWVRFERKAVKDGFKSEMEGRPIYNDTIYVRIQQPGERDVYNQPATEDHIRRFPKQYQAFLANAEQIPEGTPIGLLFPNQDSVREMMLDLKIHTVEQLAQLSEHAVERLGMDGRRYVAKALAFLEKSEAFKEVTRLSHEVDDLKGQNKVLQDTNGRLQDAYESLLTRVAELEDRGQQEPPRRGPGRPPKAWQTPPPERPEVVG